MTETEHLKSPQQVNIHHCLECIAGHALGRRREIARRTGDQHIDGTQLAVGLLKNHFQSPGIAHIGSKAQYSAAIFLQCQHRRIDFGLGATEYGNRRTGLRKTPGNTQVDTAGAAGNKHHAATIIERTLGHKSVS